MGALPPILSGGEKQCEVRYPTDEEWCAWARAQRTVRHFLGRGKSQSEDVDLPKINAELFRKIRIDQDGPAFDDAEAGVVIGRVERSQITGIEREGDLIARARLDYGTTGLEVHDQATIAPAEEGAWVEAWVWVDYKDCQEEDG